MKANVSARGYTSVLLVLNMKRFVQERDQARFEKIRGRDEFAQALREAWPRKIADQEKFITLQEDRRRRGRPENMTTEQAGYATGVFRSLMLERYTFPAYALDKAKIEFHQDLITNFQFRNLFMRVWNKWSIYIRATYTGFFIIRLTRRHFDQPRPIFKLAQDVLQLQESLDIKSALNWLKESKSKYANDPKTLSVKEQSVKALLAWLGTDETYSGDLLYYPIQWRLAMEVCGLFVNTIGLEIPLNGDSEPIHLNVPEPSISLPLHDSYVVHHFNELLADPSMVKRSKPNILNKNSQIVVDLNDMRASHSICQALSNLIEGSVLKPSATDNPLESTIGNTGFFPDHRWSFVDEIPKYNQATWNDELCILKSRTAIIMPALKWKDYEISVSSVPGATLRVNYLRYWGAIERMLEFLIEIRVLTQLIESESYRLLGEIAQTLHDTRAQLFSGDIKLDQRLPDLITRAAYLRHLAALSQSLSHPHLWSRAEYAIEKANHFLDQLGIPLILQHIERNINSINSVVDHIDELYLADLSEKQNDNATILSIGLAAASLTLTLLMLPSFWADIWVSLGKQDTVWHWALVVLGTGLSILLIGGALYMLRIATIQHKKVKKMFDKFLEGGS